MIAARTELSRGEARRRLSLGAVFLDGRRVRHPAEAVAAGQEVRVHLEEGGRDPLAGAGPAEAPPLRLLHRDADLVAVDKPAGVPAQGTPGNDRDTLLRRAEALLGGRPLGLVHRLDLDTSGVTVFGRHRAATSALAGAFREGQARKVYVAVTVGCPEPAEGRIDRPLARHPTVPGRFVAVARGGVPAATRWRVVARFGESVLPGGFALVRLEPETGRTHQLRVHLSHLGAPIVGDRRYGAPPALTRPDGRRLEPRMLLHAWRLALPHPAGGRRTFEAPLPPDLLETVAALGGPAADEVPVRLGEGLAD